MGHRRSSREEPAPAAKERGARAWPTPRASVLLSAAFAIAVPSAPVTPASAPTSGPAAARAAPSKLPTAADWAGKGPFDVKPDFFQNPALRAAGAALLGAKRWDDITSDWKVVAPIHADGDALLAWNCKPHDCGYFQQATLIDAGRVMICLTDSGVSLWYLPDRKRPVVAGLAGCNFETVQDARRGLAAAR